MAFEKYTQFQVKKNATYHGDPNGSYIMAEDINLIQDAVTQLEQTVGLNSDKLTISERIENMKQNAALKADKFVVYQGNPLMAYETVNEAIHSFSFIEHLVLEKQDNDTFKNFISEIQSSYTKVYGYIDCDSAIPLSSIQLDMEWWRTQGAVGIYLANFDYESGNTRARQNDLISSIHERGMRAVVTGNVDTVLVNAEDASYNPDEIPLDLADGDAYHLVDAFISSGNKRSYDEVLALGKQLVGLKESLGISIYVEDTANGDQSYTQGMYEHGHSLTLLFGFDGYFLNRTDFYQLNDPLRLHAWAPFLGAWGDGNITLVETIGDVRRRTSFGEIIYVKSSNTIVYTGLTIPPEILQWKDNSLSGTVIQDGTIPDEKIESYNGDRLITAINSSTSGEKISLTQVEDIMVDGGFSVDLLKTATIESINTRTQEDFDAGRELLTIDSRALGELSVDNMKGNVIAAINQSSTNPDITTYIHGSVIGDIDGASITTGDIAPERMAANIIQAINESDTDLKIESLKIAELQADRMQAQVINAINLYAKSGVFDQVYIESGAVGSLEARNIQTAVMGALEANIGHATINNALIGELEATHIQASVMDALKANIGQATIDNALIGALEAHHIQTSVISALEANVGIATINQALIGELDASHIQASVMDALKANIGTATIDTALIGDLTADHIKGSVIEALRENVGIAYIDSGVIGTLEARSITTNIMEALEAHIGTATINNALIGNLDANHIKGSVVEAINLSADTAFIKGAKIEDGTITNAQILNGTITNAEIANGTIKTANIELGAVTSAIIGEGQVKTVNIEQGSITDALIQNLSADKINAGTINSSLVKIQGDNGFLRLWGDRLQVFDDQPVPVERVSVGDVNGDGTQFGFRVRGADGQTVLYDEKGVYNEGITDGAITNPKIGDDAVDGRVIQAESIFSRHIVSEQILAAHIAAGQITADHILAGTITAASGIIANGAIGRAQISDAAIGSAQIDAAVITDAHIQSLNADKITAGKIKAQYVEIDSTTSFASGYNPATINTNIRADLNLQSSLPTQITMSGEGIKAVSEVDPTKYVLINQNGIYVHNGAIVIDGGLSKDNIDPALASKWDAGAQFAEDMANDDIITPSEKSQLAKDYKTWEAEYSSLVAQGDWYWPDNSTAPVAKTDYITKWGLLREYLTATPDINTLRPILYAANMMMDSQVDGAVLNQKIADYKAAALVLQQALTIEAKDLADAAQQNVDDVENNIVYKLEVFSTQGNIFKNGQIGTTLQARVWHGSVEVTDQFPAEKFQWTRVSDDIQGDAAWNSNHFAGTKTVNITRDDVWVRATFNCELLD